MHIISHKRLIQASETHPAAATAIDRWYRIAKRADWRSIMDVRAVFPNADPVGEHTVFNISGNNYRLISAIKYVYQKAYIIDFLTHAEYDGWCKQQRGG